MKICKFEGCDRPFQARELCNTHYAQLRQGKELTPIREPKTLEESVKEFTPTIPADKLKTGSVSFTATTSKGVTEEAVRDSACSYDTKVTPEAFEKWVRTHDAEVLMLAANSFAQDGPYSWSQDAAYELEYMALDRREGR